MVYFFLIRPFFVLYILLLLCQNFALAGENQTDIDSRPLYARSEEELSKLHQQICALKQNVGLSIVFTKRDNSPFRVIPEEDSTCTEYELSQSPYDSECRLSLIFLNIKNESVQLYCDDEQQQRQFFLYVTIKGTQTSENITHLFSQLGNSFCDAVIGIDLSNNNLIEVPSIISKLPHLKFCLLAHNQLCDIKPLLLCTELEEIDLRHNQIQSLPDNLSLLLPYLYLCSCRAGNTINNFSRVVNQAVEDGVKVTVKWKERE